MLFLGDVYGIGNLVKVSPGVLGISLLIAGSTHATQVPTVTIPLDQTAVASSSEATVAVKPTVEPLTELPQSTVEESTLSQLKPSDASSSLNRANSTLAQLSSTADNTVANSTEVLEQINRYSNESNNSSLNQVTNVNQLSDVSPGDWAYEALRSLVECYGCIAGYPDGTFRGNRAMTRYEFAAGLNACLQQVERLIASSTSDFVTKNDLAALQRLTDEAPNPNEGAGLFDGNYSTLAQLTFQPSSAFSIAATYVHSYDSSNLRHGTGSNAAQVNTGRPVVGNSYGIEASYAFTPQFVLSGWGGYTNATVIGTGNADVWHYSATLAIKDVGTPGSLLGFVVGMEPKLTGSDASVGALLPGRRRKDPDTGLHVEGFYRYALNKNIAITPGIIWLTAPGHNQANDDIVIGTIRTTFTF